LLLIVAAVAKYQQQIRGFKDPLSYTNLSVDQQGLAGLQRYFLAARVVMHFLSDIKLSLLTTLSLVDRHFKSQ
jgi:hypothetical protein